MPNVTIDCSSAWWVKSSGGSSYATALAGTGTIEAFNDITPRGGQYYGLGEYSVDCGVVSFNLGAVIPVGAVLAGATFSVVVILPGSIGQTWKVRLLDTAEAANATTADYKTGSGLAALPLLASEDSTGWSLYSRYSLTSVAGIAALFKLSGWIRVLVVSQRQEDGTQPSGDERVGFNNSSSKMAIEVNYFFPQNAMLVSD
jgi:hypothetical protein